MPVRPATRRDIPVMAQVLAASFGPDRLYQVMFPRMDEYWSDYEGAIREYLWVSWYDYRKVLTVSYTEEEEDDDLADDKGGSETTALLSPAAAKKKKNSKKERITGVAEWERAGPGWESVYGVWAGTWDPRLLVRPVLAFFYTLRRRIFGNRAADRQLPRLAAAGRVPAHPLQPFNDQFPPEPFALLLRQHGQDLQRPVYLSMWRGEELGCERADLLVEIPLSEWW